MSNCSLITLANLYNIIIASIETLLHNFEDFMKNQEFDDITVSKFMREADMIHKMDNITNYLDKVQYVNQFVKSETISIKECIGNIIEQIKIIDDRLSYNKSLWLPISVRKFRFNNRFIELNALIKVLGARLCTLNSYSDINGIMYATRLGTVIE